MHRRTHFKENQVEIANYGIKKHNPPNILSCFFVVPCHADIQALQGRGRFSAGLLKESRECTGSYRKEELGIGSRRQSGYRVDVNSKET